VLCHKVDTQGFLNNNGLTCLFENGMGKFTVIGLVWLFLFAITLIVIDEQLSMEDRSNMMGLLKVLGLWRCRLMAI
jgi:hypothetical protein